MEVVVILHNIRSAHNVGSVFRTADAAGVKKIYLTGYTPAPFDKYGRVQKGIKKTALGAEGFIQWEYKKRISDVVRELKKEKFSVIAVEQIEKSKDFKKHKTKRNTAFIFGNEVRGLSKQTLAMCDAVIEIPMHGKKESLNVAVTAGIILFGVK